MSIAYKWSSFHLGLRSRVALRLERRILSLSRAPFPVVIWAAVLCLFGDCVRPLKMSVLKV